MVILRPSTKAWRRLRSSTKAWQRLCLSTKAWRHWCSFASFRKCSSTKAWRAIAFQHKGMATALSQHKCVATLASQHKGVATIVLVLTSFRKVASTKAWLDLQHEGMADIYLDISLPRGNLQHKGMADIEACDSERAYLHYPASTATSTLDDGSARSSAYRRLPSAKTPPIRRNANAHLRSTAESTCDDHRMLWELINCLNTLWPAPILDQRMGSDQSG